MRNIILYLFLALTVITFSTPSEARVWHWHQSPQGYYARINDGFCSMGVTVFHSNHPDYGNGWKIAYDNKFFVNLNVADEDVAMAHAVEYFYSTYCQSARYNPTCPLGFWPLSTFLQTCDFCAS
jgi:hypothetical protein